MSLFDFLTKQKETKTVTDTRNPETQAADRFFSNYLQQYGGQYQPQKPYEGKFTAGMTPFEKQGLDQFLAQYLNQPDVSGQMGDVRNYYSKQLTGGFDPYTSDQYKAFRDVAQYNKGEATKGARADLGARNKFFSSEAVQKEGDINAQTSNALNQYMAELANQERNRSAQAAPQAAGLEQYISGIPLQKAQAATSVGALPRLIEQADLEAVYQDFLRRQTEGQQVLSQGRAGISNQPLDVQINRNPSLLQSLTPILSTGLAAALAPATGGSSLFLSGLLGGSGGGTSAYPSGSLFGGPASQILSQIGKS